MDIFDKYEKLFSKVHHDDSLEDVLHKFIEDGVFTQDGDFIRVESPSIAHAMMFKQVVGSYDWSCPYLECRILLDKVIGHGQSEAFLEFSEYIEGFDGKPDGTKIADCVFQVVNTANGLNHCANRVMPYCRRDESGALTTYDLLDSDAITALAYSMESENQQTKATMKLFDKFNEHGLDAHLVPIDGYDRSNVLLVASRHLPLGMMMYSNFDSLESKTMYTINLPIGSTFMRVAHDNMSIPDKDLLDAILKEDSKFVIHTASSGLVHSVMEFLKGNYDIGDDYYSYAISRDEHLNESLDENPDEISDSDESEKDSSYYYYTDKDWDKNKVMSYYKLYN